MGNLLKSKIPISLPRFIFKEIINTLGHKIPFIMSFSYNVFKRSRKKNREIKAGNVMKEWSERRNRYGTIKE